MAVPRGRAVSYRMSSFVSYTEQGALQSEVSSRSPRTSLVPGAGHQRNADAHAYYRRHADALDSAGGRQSAASARGMAPAAEDAVLESIRIENQQRISGEHGSCVQTMKRALRICREHKLDGHYEAACLYRQGTAEMTLRNPREAARCFLNMADIAERLKDKNLLQQAEVALKTSITAQSGCARNTKTWVRPAETGVKGFSYSMKTMNNWTELPGYI